MLKENANKFNCTDAVEYKLEMKMYGRANSREYQYVVGIFNFLLYYVLQRISQIKKAEDSGAVPLLLNLVGTSSCRS
jgi:hypothetical protein